MKHRNKASYVREIYFHEEEIQVLSLIVRDRDHTVLYEYHRYSCRQIVANEYLKRSNW